MKHAEFANVKASLGFALAALDDPKLAHGQWCQLNGMIQEVFARHNHMPLDTVRGLARVAIKNGAFADADMLAEN